MSAPLSSNALLRGKGTSTSMVTGGRRKIHTSFEHGEEMVEEYDVSSDILLVRKLRARTSLGAWGPWSYEVGEEKKSFNPSNDLIAESSANPSFSRQDSSTAFEFRIRNLPYSKPIYSVEVDSQTQEIVVRTSNKKYYKRISIPELKALPEPFKTLQPGALRWDHANNTLLIQYLKPPPIQELEQRAKAERAKMGTNPTAKEGDVDCKQQ